MTEPETHTFTLPVELKISLNTRAHWAVKAKRVAEERRIAAMFFPAYWRRGAYLNPSVRWVVDLVRIAPREVDDDNLRGMFKGIRDELAAQLGLDDRDERIQFRGYGQERGKVRQHLVRVSITAVPPECQPNEQAGTAIAPKR